MRLAWFRRGLVRNAGSGPYKVFGRQSKDLRQIFWCDTSQRVSDSWFAIKNWEVVYQDRAASTNLCRLSNPPRSGPVNLKKLE